MARVRYVTSSHSKPRTMPCTRLFNHFVLITLCSKTKHLRSRVQAIETKWLPFWKNKIYAPTFDIKGWKYIIAVLDIKSVKLVMKQITVTILQSETNWHFLRSPKKLQVNQNEIDRFFHQISQNITADCLSDYPSFYIP